MGKYVTKNLTARKCHGNIHVPWGYNGLMGPMIHDVRHDRHKLGIYAFFWKEPLLWKFQQRPLGFPAANQDPLGRRLGKSVPVSQVASCWIGGKSTGDHGFYRQILGFPAIFPVTNPMNDEQEVASDVSGNAKVEVIPTSFQFPQSHNDGPYEIGMGRMRRLLSMARLRYQFNVLKCQSIRREGAHQGSSPMIWSGKSRKLVYRRTETSWSTKQPTHSSPTATQPHSPIPKPAAAAICTSKPWSKPVVRAWNTGRIPRTQSNMAIEHPPFIVDFYQQKKKAPSNWENLFPATFWRPRLVPSNPEGPSGAGFGRQPDLRGVGAEPLGLWGGGPESWRGTPSHHPFLDSWQEFPWQPTSDRSGYPHFPSWKPPDVCGVNWWKKDVTAPIWLWNDLPPITGWTDPARPFWGWFHQSPPSFLVMSRREVVWFIQISVELADMSCKCEVTNGNWTWPSKITNSTKR